MHVSLVFAVWVLLMYRSDLSEANGPRQVAAAHLGNAFLVFDFCRCVSSVANSAVSSVQQNTSVRLRCSGLNGELETCVSG